VGVSLLTVVSAFADLIASLPTGLVTTLLQVAIAFKAVKIAAAGFSVVSAGILAVTTQITAMRTAAAGATTRIAALSLAFRALSVTAKLAVASTGIGLLLILMSELSQMGKSTPPNVDRLTTALGKLGSTGKVTGEAAKAFGADLGKLKDQINKVTDPSIAESVNNWGHDITGGILAAGDATEEVTQSFDAIDEALSNLVRGGKAELAGAALANMLKGMNSEQVEKMRGSLDDYDAALADAAFEQKLAADAMGVFGAQAIEVQGKLDAQKQSVAGLQQSVHALNSTYLQSRGDVRAMEAAIDAATESLKENGRTLDDNTEGGRENNASLDAIAATTMKAVEAKYLETGSWEAALEVYKRGRGALDVAAAGMATNEKAAKALADQILKTPDKTAMLKGDLTDLQAKLADAKVRLSTVPDSRKAAVRAEISQLEAKIARAKAALASLHDKKVTLTMIERRIIETSRRNVGPTGELAHGGIIGAQGGGPRSRQTLVGEQGPELVDLAPGSRVHSNPDTRRIMAGAGSRGGGGPIELVINLDGREVARGMWDPMRAEVWDRAGGSVQKALGRG
jgi:predicted  nucleic acid-binding Zn-ribbon protein